MGDITETLIGTEYIATSQLFSIYTYLNYRLYVTGDLCGDVAETESGGGFSYHLNYCEICVGT